MSRGLDRATIPVWRICGLVGEERTRDDVSALISGATSIKTALDGSLGGVVSSLRVTDCRVDTYQGSPDGNNQSVYVAVRFQCDVASLLGGFDLAATMDAIAAAMVSAGAATRAYGYPSAIVQRGQAVVGYPESLDFDQTFGS
jgi:hypothetical protein